MYNFGKNFDGLTTADIQSLVDNQVAEMRSLEYKSALPGNSHDDKKEFLADVSSFANSGGGFILYGVTEQLDANGKGTGIPASVEGIANLNPDPEILRLENCIRDGIDPRIPQIKSRTIPGFAQGPVLAIEIGSSWISPHLVKYQNLSRFFGRGSNGKFQMDVQQIRSAVLGSESLAIRIRDFRADRVARIAGGEETLRDTGKLILHLVPFNAFGSDNLIDISALRHQPGQLAPISSHGYGERINLEGVRSYFSGTQDQNVIAYTQFYRSGIVEAVDTMYLELDPLPAKALERALNTALGRYLAVQRDAGIQPPIVMMLTLVGAKGKTLAVWNQQMPQFPGMRLTPIERDILLLPETIIQDYKEPADRLLRPIYNSLYNAAGLDGCPHYDAAGNWIDDGR